MISDTARAVELSGTIWVTSLLPGKPSHHESRFKLLETSRSIAEGTRRGWACLPESASRPHNRWGPASWYSLVYFARIEYVEPGFPRAIPPVLPGDDLRPSSRTDASQPIRLALLRVGAIRGEWFEGVKVRELRLKRILLEPIGSKSGFRITDSGHYLVQASDSALRHVVVEERQQSYGGVGMGSTTTNVNATYSDYGHPQALPTPDCHR